MNSITEAILIYVIYVYYKYKFNRPHGPCDMTNYTNKHYTIMNDITRWSVNLKCSKE